MKIKDPFKKASLNTSQPNKMELLWIHEWVGICLISILKTQQIKLIRLNLEIQLTIKISEKTEQRRFGVILAPFSS